MNYSLRSLLLALMVVAFLVGCSSDDDDGDGNGNPSGGKPTAEMIDSWAYQSVTVDGAAVNYGASPASSSSTETNSVST
jgi:hypothetical protein